MNPKKKKAIEKEDTKDLSKHPYSTPELHVHGTVEELTNGSGIGTADSPILSGSLICDRNLKEHFATVNIQQILAQLLRIRIETWNYRYQDPTIRHIGPTAQEFYSTFSVGENDRCINSVDAHGVAIAAIQAVHQMVEKQHLQILELRTELDELRQRVLASEARLDDSTRLTAPAKIFD